MCRHHNSQHPLKSHRFAEHSPQSVLRELLHLHSDFLQQFRRSTQNRLRPLQSLSAKSLRLFPHQSPICHLQSHLYLRSSPHPQSLLHPQSLPHPQSLLHPQSLPHPQSLLHPHFFAIRIFPVIGIIFRILRAFPVIGVFLFGILRTFPVIGVFFFGILRPVIGVFSGFLVFTRLFLFVALRIFAFRILVCLPCILSGFRDLGRL